MHSKPAASGGVKHQMNIDHYLEFKKNEKKCLKKQASISLRSFISSFESENEIEDWVWKYLSKLKINNHSRIRHEIFHELVFPVLKHGYENSEFLSTLWLGKFAQNIYQDQKLHQKLGWVTELDLFNKSHELEPANDEARLLLLNSLVAWMKYSEHEWPSGILYGNDGATIQQCDDISLDVQKVKNLDKEQRYNDFLQQYVEKLSEYRTRLNNKM